MIEQTGEPGTLVKVRERLGLNLKTKKRCGIKVKKGGRDPANHPGGTGDLALGVHHGYTNKNQKVVGENTTRVAGSNTP